MRLFRNSITCLTLATAVALCGLACQPPADEPDAGAKDAGTFSDASNYYDAWVPNPNSWLRNASESCGSSLLVPDPGEEGHLAAARLTPAVYPFQVLYVRYLIGDGEAGSVDCDSTLAHQLTLYVSSDAAPPESPNPVYSTTIPTADPSEIGHEGRVVKHDLTPPLILNEGEHLFVAIELAGVHPDVMCLPVNDEDPYEGDRNYWSTAVAAPYGWVQLDSFGLVGSIMVSAYGDPQ